MLWDGLHEAGIVVPYNIMHIETEQDTVEENKNAAEIYQREKKKKSDEMPQSAPSYDITQAIPSAAVSVNNASVAAVPTEPPASFEDYEQSDMDG
jgi:hypothetical protein